jgi:hypothetical protein
VLIASDLPCPCKSCHHSLCMNTISSSFPAFSFPACVFFSQTGPCALFVCFYRRTVCAPLPASTRALPADPPLREILASPFSHNSVVLFLLFHLVRASLLFFADRAARSCLNRSSLCSRSRILTRPPRSTPLRELFAYLFAHSTSFRFCFFFSYVLLRVR